MANLRVGTGITFDGGTGNINAVGVVTASGGIFNTPTITQSGNVGIQTNSITNTPLVGAGNSMVGMYIGDGSLLFSNTLKNSGGYYIATHANGLNAGPVTLDATMTVHGTWTIV